MAKYFIFNSLLRKMVMFLSRIIALSPLVKCQMKKCVKFTYIVLFCLPNPSTLAFATQGKGGLTVFCLPIPPTLAFADQGKGG